MEDISPNAVGLLPITQSKELSCASFFFSSSRNPFPFTSLAIILQDPRFAEYYLNFTNQVSAKDLEKLAETDENNFIKSVQEVYADYYTINRDLFSLNLPSTFGLSKPKEQWKQ